MKQHYIPLLISLLFLSGCKKEVSQSPESLLSGRWDWVETKLTFLKADGASVAQVVTVGPTSGTAHYMVVTADSMNLYYQNGRVLRQSYTKMGSNTFFPVSATGPYYQWTIQEYSSTHVVLRAEVWTGNKLTSYKDDEYK